MLVQGGQVGGVSMADLYEVVYIDKFEDITEATVARESLKTRFGLNDQMLSTLSSGVPVVVKKNVELDDAQRYQEAIKDSGGVCWIQEMSPDGRFHERRQDQRRHLRDRRQQVRGSAIVPDRRAGKGRRSDDPH